MRYSSVIPYACLFLRIIQKPASINTKPAASETIGYASPVCGRFFPPATLATSFLSEMLAEPMSDGFFVLSGLFKLPELPGVLGLLALFESSGLPGIPGSSGLLGSSGLPGVPVLSDYSECIPLVRCLPIHQTNSTLQLYLYKIINNKFNTAMCRLVLLAQSAGRTVASFKQCTRDEY